MAPWSAARPDSLGEIDTATLLPDLEAFERNRDRTAQALKGELLRNRRPQAAAT